LAGKILERTMAPYVLLCKASKNFSSTSSIHAGMPDQAELFHLPLSVEAYAEYIDMQTLNGNVALQEQYESWMALNSSTIFKVSPAYKHRMLSNGYGKHVASKSTRCSLIPNRLNTKELLQRKCFFMPTKRCKLCETTGLETRTRLFFECSFAVMCWKYLCPDRSVPNSGAGYHSQSTSSYF
jgi:hypothetical protein